MPAFTDPDTVSIPRAPEAYTDPKFVTFELVRHDAGVTLYADGVRLQGPEQRLESFAQVLQVYRVPTAAVARVVEAKALQSSEAG